MKRVGVKYLDMQGKHVLVEQRSEGCDTKEDRSVYRNDQETR